MRFEPQSAPVLKSPYKTREQLRKIYIKPQLFCNDIICCCPNKKDDQHDHIT